jgi:hypothetical protein
MSWLYRKIAKRLKLWRRVKEIVAFDRAEIDAENDPLYEAKKRLLNR